MQFVDTDNGWMAGCIFATALVGHCDLLLSTRDGGNTWTPATWLQNEEVVDLAFISPMDGWALAAKCGGAYCKDASAQLFNTSDSGATWTELRLPAPARSPLSVRRVDADTAWVLTQDSLFITYDNGTTWTTIENPCRLEQANLAGDFRGGPLDFVDSVHGWIGCTGPGAASTAAKTIFQTLDGGLTWRLVAQTHGFPDTSPPGVGALSWGGTVTDLHFFDATTGWLDFDGPQSFVYHTDDGGQTWDPVNDGVGGGIAHLFFTDPTHGWAWGGVFLRTTDGGAHWQQVQTPP